MDPSLITPLGLGDSTATKSNKEVLITDPTTEKIGSGDTKFIPNFLSEEEAKSAFDALNVGGEIKYQQWHHMPDKKQNLLPLSRLKIAMANTDEEGWTPHYRFPVNNQDKHGVFPFSPTVQAVLDKLVALTGIPFNHAVVLLYRDGNDCIGFHKDKTLDLSSVDPIASISLGQERSYILRDDIRMPKSSQELRLTNGSLLLLGAQTNKEWYHSIPLEKGDVLPRISITFRVVTTFKHKITGELKGQGEAYAMPNWPTELGGSHVDYPDYNELLDFWFGKSKSEYRSGLWWNGTSPEIKELNSIKVTDEFITDKWGSLFEFYTVDPEFAKLTDGSTFSPARFTGYIDLFRDNHYLKHWMDTLDGTVALMILFDQFSRHVFRGTAMAYAYDTYAIMLATHIIDTYVKSGTTGTLTVYKIFAYVALMHSEIVGLVADATLEILKMIEFEPNEKMKWELKKLGNVSQQHLDVLKRFGRYPHRNIFLGRTKTAEEIEFLSTKWLPRWMKTTLPDLTKTKSIEGKIVDDDKTKKLKILVLHSNRQTAQTFKNKTVQYLEKKLQSFVELTYGEAPELYQPAGEADDIIKKNEYSAIPNVGFSRAWWNASDDPKTMVYAGLERSLEYVDSLFKTNDFDGIIGFSQGGTLTGIIAALVNDYRKGKPVFPLKYIAEKLRFVAIISGFYCRDTRPEFINCILEEQPVDHFPDSETGEVFVKVRKDLINIPSFHSWGLTDTLVNPWRSEKLSQAFDESKQVHVHPSGHFVKAIKYWPMDEMFMWLKQFITETTTIPNYIKLANLIVNDGALNSFNLEQYRASHPDIMHLVVKHIIFNRACDSNVLYEILTKLYSTDNGIYDALFKMMHDSYILVEHLVHFDTQCLNEGLRDILVKLITNEMVREYKKYCVDKSDGFPSNLATYAPNRNALYCGTGLFRAIASRMATLINTYDMTLSCIEDADPKRQKLQSYTQYRRITAALRNLILVSKPKPVEKKYIPRSLGLSHLLSAPVSDYILNPRAEPVDISAPDLLAPLYAFLQGKSTNATNGKISEDGKVIDEIAFERGTICTDNRLDLCKQVIGPVGVHDLIKSLRADSLKSEPTVKHLLLGNNICGNTLGFEIAEFIKSGKSALTTWYIAGNNLDEVGIAPICEALKTDRQVRQLWLKRNPLRLAGARHLADMMHYNTYLQILDLTNTGLLDDGASVILRNLSDSITHLYLSSNGLTSKTCEVVAEMLHTKNLDQLSLGCNRLTDEGAKFIAQALAHPECKLKSIEIASCGIGPIGTKYLAEALKINTSLIFLNLGFLKSTTDLGEVPNMIESQGAIYLADGIASNSTLCALDLTYTGIQQSGISALASVLEKNTNLMYFNIEQFGIPHNELSREIIRRTVQRNRETMAPDKLKYIMGVIDPPHLEEIKSVYRIQ